MLHFTREEESEADQNSQREMTESTTTDKSTHNSGGACGTTGARKDSHVLSIVPVCVSS